MSKKDLVEMASAHPDFTKSMAREKKEVLVRFLITRDAAGTASAAPPPPPPSTPTKKTVVSRMTKAELLEHCQDREGFDATRHGKTRATLLEFVRLPVDEKGTDPVDVGALLETPDDVGVIKAAILRLLMDTEPFKEDPELGAKLDKIL